MREAGGLADDDADAGAALVAAAHLLDLALVHRRERRGLVLAEELGELAASRERLGEDVVGGVSVDERGRGHGPSVASSVARARRPSPSDLRGRGAQASLVIIRQAPSAVQTTSHAMTTTTATRRHRAAGSILAFGPPPRAEDPGQPVRFEVRRRDADDRPLEVDHVRDADPREDRREHDLEHDHQDDRHRPLAESAS